MNTTAAPTADPYWSRTGDQCELAPRQDPTVWTADSAVSLHDAWSAEQQEDYARKGFAAVQDLLTEPEARTLLSEANRLAEAADVSQPDVIAEPTSQIVRSLFQVHDTSDVFRNIATDPRLVNRARQLLGSDVYIHQSRINFKPALNGKEFFWHSDFETWHVEDGMPRMRAVSVSIALTPNHEFNGPLMLIPGSHQWYVRCVGETPENHFEQSLKKQQYGVPDRGSLERLVANGGIEAPKGPPGSAVFFECNTMHGSTGNLSPFPRTNLFLVYNSVDNALQEPFGSQPPRPDFLAERNPVSLET